MRKALSVVVVFALFASPLTAAPSNSFPILRSLINCLLAKTRKTLPNSNTSSGVGIIKTGSGTFVINSNSGTYSGGVVIYAGSLGWAGGTINLGTASTGTLGYFNIPGRTVFAGEDVEFVLNSIPLMGTITYQWQSSSNHGFTWTDLEDGAQISGSHSNRLVLREVDKSMDGRLYQCLVYSNGTPINPVGMPGLLTVQ